MAIFIRPSCLIALSKHYQLILNKNNLSQNSWSICFWYIYFVVYHLNRYDIIWYTPNSEKLLIHLTWNLNLVLDTKSAFPGKNYRCLLFVWVLPLNTTINGKIWMVLPSNRSITSCCSSVKRIKYWTSNTTISEKNFLLLAIKMR